MPEALGYQAAHAAANKQIRSPELRRQLLFCRLEAGAAATSNGSRNGSMVASSGKKDKYATKNRHAAMPCSVQENPRHRHKPAMAIM